MIIKWKQMTMIVITLVMCVIFTFVEKGLAKSPPLLIVTDPFEPFVFPSDAELKGLDYDVTEAVFHMLQIPVEIKFYPFSRCLYMMRNQDADALIDLVRSEERNTYMVFPEEPLSDTSLIIFYHKGNRPQIETLDDLKFYKIGSQVSSEYPQELAKVMVHREDVRLMEQNFHKLVFDRIDIMVENRIVGRYIASKMGILDQIEVLELPKSFPTQYYLGFAKNEGHDRLAEQFSQALVQFKQTQAYQDILVKYGQAE